mgnify:CR=1 FL=1
MRLKPPFKADSSDVVLCPRLGREISVEAHCHGWALRDELCHDADECEPYLEFAEKKLIELQGKRRKIRLQPELYKVLEERAKAKGLTPDQLVGRIILNEVKKR